jgi:hypothetical protein
MRWGYNDGSVTVENLYFAPLVWRGTNLHTTGADEVLAQGITRWLVDSMGESWENIP